MGLGDIIYTPDITVSDWIERPHPHLDDRRAYIDGGRIHLDGTDEAIELSKRATAFRGYRVRGLAPHQLALEEEIAQEAALTHLYPPGHYVKLIKNDFFDDRIHSLLKTPQRYAKNYRVLVPFEIWHGLTTADGGVIARRISSPKRDQVLWDKKRFRLGSL